jgi:VanZ family protein
MGLIYYLSSRSVLPGPIAEPAPDGELYRQLIHMFEYAVLTGFLYRALAFRRVARRLWPLGIAMALAAAYAISDERHQSFVPNRDPSLHDLFTDAVGVAAALAAIALVSLVRKRRGGRDGRGGVKIVLVLPPRPPGPKATKTTYEPITVFTKSTRDTQDTDRNAS